MANKLKLGADIFETALGGQVRASGKAKRIWHKGKWHDPDSDDLPVWIRPRTPEEIAANERGMRQWLADAAADPRTLKRIGGAAAITTAGAYATSSPGRHRKKGIE